MDTPPMVTLQQAVVPLEHSPLRIMRSSTATTTVDYGHEGGDEQKVAACPIETQILVFSFLACPSGLRFC